MASNIEDPTKENLEEEFKNIETISSEEEISENADQNDSPKNNIASLITTPYERVLSIINEAKAFILSVSSTQQNLVDGLEWAIKVISSHNLYTYELKDHEENEDFKQFQQFVNSYNDVIDIGKKPNEKKSFLVSSLNLKRPNSFKYSLHRKEKEKEIEEEKDEDEEKNDKDKIDNIQSNNPINTKILENNKDNKEDKIKSAEQNSKGKNTKIENKNNNNNNNNNNKSNNIKSKFFKGSNNNIKNNNTQPTTVKNVVKNNMKKLLSKLEKSENSKTEKNAKIKVKETSAFPKSEKKNKIKAISPIKQLKKNIDNININTNVKPLSPKTEFKSKSQIQGFNINNSKSSKVIKTFNRIKPEKISIKSSTGISNILKEENFQNFENIVLNKSFSKYSSNLIESA